MLLNKRVWLLAAVLSTLSVCSLDAESPAGDLNSDWQVNHTDLKLFAEQWLDLQGGSADLNGDAKVNMGDFGLFAENWLRGACPIVINEIHYNPDEESELVEYVELYNAGKEDIDLSGWLFSNGISYVFDPGTILPADGYLIVAENPSHVQTKWGSGRFGINTSSLFGPYQGRLDNDGERIALSDAEGHVMDEVDYKLGFPWPTVGDPIPAHTAGTGSSMQLVNPRFDNDLGGSWRSATPTPAAKNTPVYAENTSPHLRQVKHSPKQPTSNQEAVITVKATDQDGVGSVTLEYQVVLAGQYIPALLPVPLNVLQSNPDTSPLRNANYSNLTNWIGVTMSDDGTKGDMVAGDSIYTVILPKQPNRTLVRYRISAQDHVGMQVTGPYPDDPSLNFAYYIYDGVPDYEGFSAEMLCSLPIYHLLTRSADIHQALGYNSSDQISQFMSGDANPVRFVYNWPGTLVYDGVVYDNIKYRLRGANGRYLGGNTKRSMRFRLNRGHYFQAKDMQGKDYPTKWRTLTTAKGFDNRLTLTFSLNEHINFYLFNKLGVPAPWSHYFHFRVVDGMEEAPDPWRGDFWGLWFAQETYDVRFLEAHDLEKGNLYKLINSTTDAKQQQRYQAPYAVTDGSDHNNIEYYLTGYDTAESIKNQVRLDKWYVYHALAQAIRNYDYWPSANKNAAWYFEPDYRPENNYLGLMWTLPWDTDASWGPTWNNGHDVVYNSIFPASGGGSDGGSTPELQPDYYSAVREIRDLLWQRNQIEPLIDELAGPITDFAEADLRRWQNAPSDAGNYNGLSGAGKSGLPALVQDMKNFAFVGGSWPGGSVGAGGRAPFLDSLADGAEGHLIPNRPTIVYVGEPEYPNNALYFHVSTFSDPQGAHTFEAMKWRIAAVEPFSIIPGPSPDETGLIDRQSHDWKYFNGTREPSDPVDAWRQIDFDDSTWSTGQTSIGYGDYDDNTILYNMRYNYSTIYLRHYFTISDLSAVGKLKLDVYVDDGCVVWINGSLAGRYHVSAGDKAYNDASGTNHEAVWEPYTLPEPYDYLVEGTNVIAIHALNQSLSNSSDFSIDIKLYYTDETNGGGPGGGTTGPYIKPGKYEIDTVWESGEITEFDSSIRIPASAVRIGRTYRVRCRMKDNTGRWSHWSDPNQFVVGEPLAAGILDDLRITELMYNPADADTAKGELDEDNNEFEFIELKDVGDESLDLTYVSFVEGITFDFNDSSVTSLAPGEFVLVVKNKTAFESRYGTGLSNRIAGQYNGKLANGGENITLKDFWNGIIAEFEYNDSSGWPLSADGAGHSLVPMDAALPGEPEGSLNYSGNWRASTYINGSPGQGDPELATTMVINEIMAHTDYSNPLYPDHDSNDWIELYNTTGANISLYNWYLSDDIVELKKWAVPAIEISGHGRISFDETTGFHNPITVGFGLNKAGEQVVLSYLPGNQEDRIVDCVQFKGQQNSISLGRYPDGGAYWFGMTPSRDAANTNPSLLEVVIDELMYHPVDTNDEYLELYNPTAGPIDLENAEGAWRLDGGVDYTFPTGISIPAGGRLIVVGFDPVAESWRVVTFIAMYDTGLLIPGTDIVGPWSGNLSNASERIALEKPQPADQPGDLVSWIIVDEVTYADISPWPEAADGTGDVLQRMNVDRYHSGNDPASWRSAAPTAGGKP